MRQCFLSLAVFVLTLLAVLAPHFQSVDMMTTALQVHITNQNSTNSGWDLLSASSLGAMWEAAAPLCMTSPIDCDRLVRDKMAPDNPIISKLTLPLSLVKVVTHQQDRCCIERMHWQHYPIHSAHGLPLLIGNLHKLIDASSHDYHVI